MKTKLQYALLTAAIFIALPAISQMNNMTETNAKQLKMMNKNKLNNEKTKKWIILNFFIE